MTNNMYMIAYLVVAEGRPAASSTESCISRESCISSKGRELYFDDEDLEIKEDLFGTLKSLLKGDMSLRSFSRAIILRSAP